MIPQGGEEAAIGGLLVQAAYLQLNLIDQGLFARGALTLGDFYIREGILFGPALTEAVELEGREAVHPRIVLSDGVIASQEHDLQFYSPPAESPQNALLLREPGGRTFLNYLGLLLDEPTDPRPDLARHRSVIEARLAEYSGDKRRWEKYRWVGEYHNHVCVSAFPTERDLLLPAERLSSSFNTFA